MVQEFKSTDNKVKKVNKIDAQSVMDRWLK